MTRTIDPPDGTESIGSIEWTDTTAPIAPTTAIAATEPETGGYR